MQTIAEAIETHEQLHVLKEIGCHNGQGYLLGKPVDADTFAQQFILRQASPSETTSTSL